MGATRFMPHGMCYLWDPSMIWINATSDFLIAMEYAAIPLLLWTLVIGRDKFPVLVNWFIAFISFCGLTHIMEVVTLWSPLYYLSTAFKVATVLASAGAVTHLVLIAIRVRHTYEQEMTDGERIAIQKVFDIIRGGYGRPTANAGPTSTNS